jgi:hypothetical protein
MIAGTTSAGNPYYAKATADTPFSECVFTEETAEQFCSAAAEIGDQLWAFHSDLGRLTVLDRLTVFGQRDIESGWWEESSPPRFWLASGMKDVRNCGATTLGEAIAWVKKHANNCIGE